MNLAKSGAASNLWVWAVQQTQGRGRDGRSWMSAPGNLYTSAFIKTDCDIKAVTHLSLVVGLAAYEALSELCSSDIMGHVRLKWPNDLLYGNAKLGGILLENYRPSNDEDLYVVMGVGINLQHHPEIEGREVMNLRDAGVDISAEDMLAALARSTAKWLSIWDKGAGFEQVRESWGLYGQQSGEAVEVHYKDTKIAGNYVGLNESGGMILQLSSGEYKDIHFGDVMLTGKTKKKI